MIEFRGVTKRFDDGTVAVDGLDLVAHPGEATVLVGPSGCGKTTTLRMVNRMIDPTSGTVEITELNRRVEVDKVPSPDVAKQFVTETGIPTAR